MSGWPSKRGNNAAAAACTVLAQRYVANMDSGKSSKPAHEPRRKGRPKKQLADPAVNFKMLAGGASDNRLVGVQVQVVFRQKLLDRLVAEADRRGVKNLSALVSEIVEAWVVDTTKPFDAGQERFSDRNDTDDGSLYE